VAAASPELHRDVHEGRGPFALLVHGILSGRAQWQPNLAALAKIARPVVVELWGHGRSPSPHDPGAYHPDAYVEAFDRIRAELGVDRWLLCGQSLGGSLTLRYALAHPDRVIAQVFTNSVSALGDEEWRNARRKTAVSVAEAIVAGGREAIERMPIHPLRATHIPEPAHRAVLDDAAMLDPEGVAMAFRHTATEASVRNRVTENRVPTLLVCGEREKRFLPERDFAIATMPHLEVVNVPGAGHAVNLEAAAEFDRAVTEFFRRHASGGPSANRPPE
jgi:pimeloyl-ACP methyl ester carboxylesterase